ncbi:MAG: heparan-alpha-glucosaminide N-acetyltransferase domain-containing protein [bacterium]
MTASVKRRIGAIDALRGLAVCLMVIHHFFYDLVWLLGAPRWLFSNPVFDPLHYFFAGTFIFLSGVACRFSRNNVRRGLIALGLALGMTLVTSLPVVGNPILFGVLHLLGTAMLFFGLAGRYLDRIPRRVQPCLYLALHLLSLWAVEHIHLGAAAAHVLFPFGWMWPGFYSADWFPLFPWLFVFLMGTWAGLYVKEGRFPAWFYRFSCPPLEQVGRVSLWVYILHQPILYGLTLLLRALLS